MLWFESLLFYGCEEREQEKDDVDVALLPTIVEKVILPKLTGRRDLVVLGFSDVLRVLCSVTLSSYTLHNRCWVSVN